MPRTPSHSGTTVILTNDFSAHTQSGAASAR